MGKRKKLGSRRRRKEAAKRGELDEPRPRAAWQRSASAEGDGEDDDEDDGAPEDSRSSEPPPDSDPDSPEERDEPVGGGDGDGDDGASGAPSGGSDSEPRPPATPTGWVRHVVAFERGWSWLEARLLFIALMALTLLLCTWISLNGMASPVATPNPAGTVFRALVGSVVLGGLVRLVLRKREMPRWHRSVATVVAVVVACAIAPLWRSVGIGYFGGLLDWAQEGSALTLVNGLRGMGTRLTILVALLGGSLAAASARHINIDVVVRFLRPSFKLPVAVIGGLATALVCFIASWGLLDYLAIDGFHAEREASPRAKVAHIQHNVGEHWFVLRKQMGLDLRALPTVLSGTRWDDDSRMNGRQWNEWIESAGFRDRYTDEQVASIRAPDALLDEPRLPFMIVPDGSPRGMLVPTIDLMFPFGFFVIGLRMLLRILMLLTGVVVPFASGGDAAAEEQEGAA